MPAKLALYVWEKAKPDLAEFVKQTQHGIYLKEIGMAEDIGGVWSSINTRCCRSTAMVR